MVLLDSKMPGITRKAIKMNVGFIGLGIMGMPMATNISKKYPLVGFDVVKVNAPFETLDSVEEVVKRSDVVISMVPNSNHVKDVYSKVYPNVRKGQIFIDMSTISPSVSTEVALEVERLGGEMLDCPVVKSQPAAVAGKLGIYVGGKKEVFAQVKDILSCMGENIIYMGDHGQGLVMKILHNALVGQIQNGVNEVMSVAKRLGLDLHDVVTAISYGGGQNFYLDGKANNIINETFPTAFSIGNMHKDAHLALDLLGEHDIDLPGFKNTARVYDLAMEEGLAREDFSASFEIVDKE